MEKKDLKKIVVEIQNCTQEMAELKLQGLLLDSWKEGFDNYAQRIKKSIDEYINTKHV